MTWVALWTTPLAELAINDKLKGKGFETLCLHYWTTVSHARKKTKVKRAYFPRYMFAKLVRPEDYREIRSTDCVKQIVHSCGEPLSVPESVILELRGRGDENGLVALSGPSQKRRKRFMTGERVPIVAGALGGFFALIVTDDGKATQAWVNGLKVTMPSSDLRAS